jgi:shikimate kinase
MLKEMIVIVANKKRKVLQNYEMLKEKIVIVANEEKLMLEKD